MPTFILDDLHDLSRTILVCFILHWYNAGMRKIWYAIVVLTLFLSLLLAACAPTTQESAFLESSTQTGTLRPYPSNTASATPLPSGYVTSTLSPTLTPTPTQVYYEVQTGDDMYSIAWRYGLSPDVIMTANPTVNPRMMSVGTSLLIPITPQPEATQPTAVVQFTPTTTPQYEALQEPDCYPDSLGGLWCFVLVTNREEGALENISAVVTLQAGEETRQEVAIMPLNLLPVGESLPLIAYFDPPVPEERVVSAAVDFLLPVMPEDDRYLNTESQDVGITKREDGLVAQVSGDILIQAGQLEADYLWLSATALDAEGHVVAVRRWDADAPIEAGIAIPFEITLYSMGEPIDQVNLLVEARARQISTPEE